MKKRIGVYPRVPVDGAGALAEIRASLVDVRGRLDAIEAVIHRLGAGETDRPS